jgi:hypothetical protein
VRHSVPKKNPAALLPLGLRCAWDQSASREDWIKSVIKDWFPNDRFVGLSHYQRENEADTHSDGHGLQRISSDGNGEVVVRSIDHVRLVRLAVPTGVEPVFQD